MSKGVNPWPIRDVGDGNVGWIQGHIIGEPPLVAPVSQRPCFYYSVLTTDRGEERAGSELMIEDATGRAVVVLARAVIQVDYDHVRVLEIASALAQGDIVAREGVLAPGELIAVHGKCVWERDPSPARYGLYRDMLPQRLRVTATSQVRLWLTEDVPERRR